MLIAAVATPDCERLAGATLQDQCLLSQSMRLDPPPDCKNRNTQFDLNVCSYRDYLRTDIELNQSWTKVSKRLKGMTAATSLIAGQRSWLQYRAKQCDVWALVYKGGTIESLVVNDCMTGITKVRVKELDQMYADLDH